MDTEKQQRWYCPSCQRYGSVTYESSADVFTVVGLLTDAHAHASPECNQPEFEVQLPKTQKALEKLIRKHPSSR